MRALETALPGVIIVESEVFSDTRGRFSEVFHTDKYRALGLALQFVQDNHSRSTRDVLRGLHYQLGNPQGKLVKAITGEIFDVAVDLRRSSTNFGRWCGVHLREGDGRQMWVPPGFAHGFLVLSDFADVVYKCTSVYDAAQDRVVRWDSPEIGVAWPLTVGRDPVLSNKDALAPTLSGSTVFT